MNKSFTDNLLSKKNKKMTIGEAVRLAKCHMVGTNPDINNLSFILIGDPAMRLTNTEYRMVIDELNGKTTQEEPSLIKAGGIVNVKGRIIDETGELANDFMGTVFPTVLDTKEKVICYNNGGYVSKPFEFIDRNKTLFVGSDSVKNGVFSFKFPVPLDINYSNESGLISLYAVDDNKSREANGYFENFLIGETEDGANKTDSVGPKILLYLNTPEFQYGGKVHETPYLVAHLEDEDGINTVGNGIGHDIMAIIDNSPVYSYNLNNYYESEVGSYARGIVRYSLPQLPEGKHQLLFRAWDIKNNSSTATLDFEVVKGLKPGLFDLDCTNSPAKENTTFILSHDRPDSELDVKITVYDFGGKELWSHMENGVSADSYYYIDWNLTTNSGQRLAPGVYLFKASISSGGSKESTKARKIVVLAQ